MSGRMYVQVRFFKDESGTEDNLDESNLYDPVFIPHGRLQEITMQGRVRVDSSYGVLVNWRDEDTPRTYIAREGIEA